MIFYGTHVAFTTKKTIELIEAVKSTILDDPEALLSWCDTRAFNRAFRCHMMRFRYCSFVKEFQKSQGLIRIFGSKNSYVDLNYGSRITQYTNLYNFNFDACTQSCNDFKKMIKILLPGSGQWSDDQWCNMNYVCTEINKKHHSKLIDPYTDFVPIHDFISCAQEGVYSDFYLPNILPEKFISPSIVKAIFKSSTDEVVHSIFCQISLGCDETKTREYLADSWMFDIIKYWAFDEKHPYCNYVKKTVFNLIFTV